ncbi:hypothetical protein ACLOJK_003898 [Asimina triloba]
MDIFGTTTCAALEEFFGAPGAPIHPSTEEFGSLNKRATGVASSSLKQKKRRFWPHLGRLRFSSVFFSVARSSSSRVRVFGRNKERSIMGSDPVTNTSSVTAFSRDVVGKKKRANRSAKLKQCKLDARREQWLSQVKNKGVDKENNRGSCPPSPLPSPGDRDVAFGNLETKSRIEGNEGSNLHDSDSESLTNSTGSSNSSNAFSRNEHNRSSSHSSSSSNGCFSGSVSQDEGEEDESCLDDWEAVADALTATDESHNPNAGATTKNDIEASVESGTNATEFSYRARPMGISKTSGDGVLPRPSAASCRAWRPDDAFRPQSLPNLSKQHSFPMNAMGGHFGNRGTSWGCHGRISQPSSCPICCEDLDLTDSSFLPCSCGFHLCLFCHKRILEDDGRCPGCRKQYSPMEEEINANVGPPLFRLARSCSLSSRS